MEKKSKASPVSRSVYQKMAEENKRLKADIYILVKKELPPSLEKILLTEKWRKKISADKKFMDDIRELIGLLVKPDKQPLFQDCGGAKCQIKNCPICKNQMY